MVFKKAETKIVGEGVLDQAAPKPKKEKKKKAAKKAPGPKLVAGALTPAAATVGHNSGEAIPALKEIIDEILASDDRVKNEGKLKRDLRNRAKTEFNVLSSVLAHEIRLRKMDKDVRIQFESGHHDLKTMTGYQQELDLKPGTVARTEEQLTDPGAPKDDVINRAG